MHSNPDNKVSCPHCGSDSHHPSEGWGDITEETTSFYCPNCKNTFDVNQSSSDLSIQEKEVRNFNISFFIIFLLLSALMIYLNRTFRIFTLKDDSWQIVYEILVILIISSGLSSGKIRKNLKYLAIWSGIFIIFIIGYSYRHELSGIKEKIVAEIIPSKGVQKLPGSISFPVSSNGHFYIRAYIDNIPIIFLADTGASHIVLSPADAEKLGINTKRLRFDRIYQTANGTVRGSSIRINDLKIGNIYLKGIGASVNEADMDESLLGMTFFNRLKGYEVKNDVLTLYWNE